MFSNDRYSGISSVGISPTQPFLNPNPWDVNLVASDVFVQNDYLYISQQSIFGLKNAEIKSVNHHQNIYGSNTANILDFYNKDLGSYHLSTDILGPSASFRTSIKDFHFTTGFFTRLRTQSSALKVDNYLKYGNQNLPEPNEYILKPLEVNVMNWAEIGLNFSTQIFPNADLRWVLGGNVKYLAGFDAATVKSQSPMKILRTDEIENGESKKTITLSEYEIMAHFATNYNFDSKKYELKQTGSGVALDLGISVIDQDVDAEDYNFKLGFHILDIGKIGFNGQNHFLKGQDIRVVNNPELDNTRFESAEQLFQFFSKQAYGDENASFRGTDFSMGLPTSVHLNFSKNIAPNQYFNIDWIQRAPIFENAIKRSNILNLSYTVQKPVLGYGASVSLYEYRALQLGGYFRIGPLILGSENFLPLIFKQEKLHSSDFYIALKLYPFWDNDLKRHRRAKCYCD